MSEKYIIDPIGNNLQIMFNRFIDLLQKMYY